MADTGRTFGAGLLAALAAGKTALLAFAVVALLGLNTATLLSERAHDLLYAGLRAVLGIAGEAAADRLTRNSLKARAAAKVEAATTGYRKANADLQKRNRKLVVEADALEQRHRTLKADHSALQERRVADGRRAKEVAGVVRNRLARGVIRSQASIPAESIPYVGIAVILGVAAWDLYDACETMKDMNALLVRLGEGEENADFCGTKLPTRAQVLELVRTQWAATLERARVELAAAPAALKIELPEVRLPSAREAASVVCPSTASFCR